MRFLRQSLVGVFLASLALALAIYAVQTVVGAVRERMSQEVPVPQARERVFAVNVERASAETTTPVLHAFGQVQSRRTLELRTPASGRVLALADDFEDGGSVRSGEVLVRIDPADAQAALDRAESDLLDARAEVRDAARSIELARDDLAAAVEQADLREHAYQRQVDLEKRGVATAAAVETAELAAASARQAVLSRRLAVAQAEARVDQAETRLARARIARDAAQRDLDDMTLTAAFDATLSDVNVVEGRLVAANEKLAVLVDETALEVAFRVSTAQYVRLLDSDGRLIAAPVRAILDVSGVDLHAAGRISRAGARTGEGQSGRVIYARLDDARGFKPGDFVTVEVDEPPISEVVRLPASALGSDGTVLVLGEADRLESLPVTLVRRQGDDVLLRGEGLEGREVIVGRTPLLGPGVRVRPLRESGEAEAEAAQEMLELSQERRRRLMAFVEASDRMPAEMKARVLSALEAKQVPAQLVQRIESRMGG